MPIPDVTENTQRLIRRMTTPAADHARFVGEPVDMEAVDGLALGDLWTVASATSFGAHHGPSQTPAVRTARAILALGEELEPVFRASACRDWLEAITVDAEAEPRPEASDLGAKLPLQRACFALARCLDLSFEELRPIADRLLATTVWRSMPHLALALGRIAGDAAKARVLATLAAEFATSPLLIDEFRAVGDMDLAANLVVADVAYPDRLTDDPDGTKGTRRISVFPRYAAFAEAALTSAAARVRDIHEGVNSYAADKAFTLDESAVIARLARVALERDEAWLPPVLDELFTKVSLAPTVAKTMPSQSVAISLGHAVHALPTPEALATLRGVTCNIRHAGVAKKLQRNVRGAERRLAARPSIALRLPPDQLLTKPGLAALVRCLEAGFETALAFSYDEWRARLAEHKQAKALTSKLVWRLSGPSGAVSVVPVADRSGVVLQDVHGVGVAADGGHRMALWHPSEADEAEREAWRDRIVSSRVVQPFKQVFREHYGLPAGDLARGETTMFAGNAVSIKPLLGLAHRQGWRIEHGCLVRPIGGLKVALVLTDRMFRGRLGWTIVEKVGIWRSGPRKDVPAAFGDLSAVACSEVLRAVDLLVSTSGFELTDAKRPLGPMAKMRKLALARALAGREGMDGLTFDARHLRIGPYAIHLATGRVTRDGDPVAIELLERLALVAVPWLPWDERLLETISKTALRIGQEVTRS